MDFIIENYIWIIVIIVILIMALIGYLAEKTDFIHANKEKKKDRKDKSDKKEEVNTVDPTSEIPSVTLETPEEESDVATDAFGFEDPFAMNQANDGTVEEMPLEEKTVSNESEEPMDVSLENDNEIQPGFDESLFAPVEKPKFGEEFAIPEDFLNKSEETPDETKVAEPEMEETPEVMETPSVEEPEESTNVVEEISADQIFGEPTALKEAPEEKEEIPLPVEDILNEPEVIEPVQEVSEETVIPELENSEEQISSDMDEWKF